MRTIIFLIVLLNILSCSIAKNNVIGEYGYEGKNTIDSIIIEKNNVYTHKIFNKERKIMYLGKSKWELEKDRITFFDFYTNEDYNLTEFLTNEQASKFLVTASYPLYKKDKYYVIEANLSMYAMGMSTRSMSDYVRDMYQMEISASEISRITDSVLPAVQQWRNRPVDSVYPFVFFELYVL